MKESELTLTVESSFSDMVATVHLQCAALKARDGTVVVDPSEFGLYDELSHSDQQTAISLFDAENIDGLFIDFNETGGFTALEIDSESTSGMALKSVGFKAGKALKESL